jgi:hypothetical protein
MLAVQKVGNSAAAQYAIEGRARFGLSAAQINLGVNQPLKVFVRALIDR